MRNSIKTTEFCSSLYKKESSEYCNNLDINKVIYIKKFRKNVKTLLGKFYKLKTSKKNRFKGAVMQIEKSLINDRLRD